MSVFSFDAVISVSGSSATKISASVAAFSVLSVVFPAISDTVSTALVSLSAAVSTVLVSSSAAVSAAPLHIFCRAAACCHANGHRCCKHNRCHFFRYNYFLFHYNFSSIYKTAQTRPITSLYRLVRCCTFYLKKYVQLPCVSIIIPYSRNRFS